MKFIFTRMEDGVVRNISMAYMLQRLNNHMDQFHSLA